MAHNSPYGQVLTENGIPFRTAQRWQQLGRLADEEFEARLAAIIVAGKSPAAMRFVQANDGIGTDEYFTPRWVFDTLAIEFDLDVAAPIGGVPHIPATHHYSPEDNGLIQPWTGRVWMNPPYSAPGLWVERFLEHGNGIALLPFAKSGWFFDLWEADGVTLVAPGIRASHFDGGQIFMATFLAAIGPDDVHAAARRLGVGR